MHGWPNDTVTRSQTIRVKLISNYTFKFCSQSNIKWESFNEHWYHWRPLYIEFVYSYWIINLKRALVMSMFTEVLPFNIWSNQDNALNIHFRIQLNHLMKMIWQEWLHLSRLELRYFCAFQFWYFSFVSDSKNQKKASMDSIRVNVFHKISV